MPHPLRQIALFPLQLFALAFFRKKPFPPFGSTSNGGNRICTMPRLFPLLVVAEHTEFAVHLP